MAKEWAIELDRLSKSYSRFRAVDRLSLQVPSGAVFGFLGPNGSGKSSTVKMMTGVLSPDEGDARILGKSVRLEPVPVKRSIGVLLDGLGLFEYLTIWEHLDIVRAVFDLNGAEFTHRSRQLLRMLDMVPDAGKLIREASYGMRKKTGLAMALLPNPDLLILDEPFEGLDPVMTAEVKSALRSAASNGKTVFLTTHMLGMVSDLLTHYAILRSGRILAQGAVDALSQAGITLEEHYLSHFADQPKEDLAWLR